MTHYKANSRLSSRKGETPEAWKDTCFAIQRLVNKWSDRYDLAVYGGEDSAEHKSIACFLPELAEIEVNVEKLFQGKTPEMVGDLAVRQTQLENPKAIGVLFHEACHARHSDNWNFPIIKDNLDPTEFKAFMLLEESRIETRGVLDNPDVAKYLRYSALEYVLEGVSESKVRQQSDIWQSAQTLALVVGRIRAGIIRQSDIPDVIPALSDVLGKDLFVKLEQVVHEFMRLSVVQQKRCMELAREWVEILREADPDGEGDQGELSEEQEMEIAVGVSEMGSEDGEGDKSDLEQALAEANSQMEEQAEELPQQEARAKEAESREKETNDKREKREIANAIFDRTSSRAGDGESNSRLIKERDPESVERTLAVQLGQSLDKAKYRERSMTEHMQYEPSGRLKTKVAIQNEALKARGSNTRLPQWRKRQRKHTSEPQLRLGIMVDISGSMGSAMEAMGQTAWIVSEAGRRIQAKTAMVYYGNGVFPILGIGQRLDKVRIYSAPDGTEEFGRAWGAIDGLLGLSWQDDVKVLVIVSDGNYKQHEHPKAVQALRECKRNGVTAVFVSPNGTHPSGARDIIREAGWGELISGVAGSDIPTEISKAITASMKAVERM